MAEMKRVPKQIIKQEDIDYLLAISEEDIGLSWILNTFGEFKGGQRFRPYDEITIPPGSFGYKGKMNKNAFKTTVGIYIFNKYFIEKDLLDFLGYMNYEINKKKLLGAIAKIAQGVLEDDLPVMTLDRFLQKTQKWMPLCTPLSPNSSDKMLGCTEVLHKKLMELVNQHKEEIENGNAIVMEQIEAEVIAYAKEYLGDDPALDQYLSGSRSNIENHFKNMYICRGALKNPDPNAERPYNIALSNYADGISKKEYSLLANSLAEGPYSRSNKTQVGGYWEKLFVSAYQHITMDKKGSDCGTTDTIRVSLTSKNITSWMYNYIKVGNNLVLLTSKNEKDFIGKTVDFRFSSMCESRTGICNMCGGELPYMRDTLNIGISMAIVPSALKNMYMSYFHDSTISTVTIDPYVAFGVNRP